MDDRQKELVIADERTAEKRYADRLEALRRQPQTYQGPRNTLWTQDGRPQLPDVPEGQFIGRVALAGPSDFIGGASDFYIGEWHVSDVDGVEVFSWAAPLSCTYFRGTKHHDLCREVAVVRAYMHIGGRIAGVEDEAVVESPPADPFRRRTLEVPAAPKGPQIALPRTPQRLPEAPPSSPAAPTSRNEAAAQTPERSQPQLQPEGVDSQTSTASERGSGQRQPPPIRASGLLRSTLAAPRGRSLGPVLSTLQPDQYALVTRPAMSSFVVEGQPGTGKTIIATHRAAYMVLPDTPVENTLDGDVLIVGPTPEYAQHVAPVIDRLTGGSPRVKAVALPDLMRQLIGLRDDFRGRTSRTWQDVDEQLWRLASKAHWALQRSAAEGDAFTVRQVFEHLRANGTPSLVLTRDTEWSNYLRTLPRYEDALVLRAHAPLLANIAWMVGQPRDLRNVEHIIVDEAQDVAPLEWRLLTAINQTEAWTLLGDLNQRRSDHTYASWQQVAEVIEHSEGLDELPVVRLELGYRSTKAILDFANKLLPRTERRLLAFQQEGPDPVVIRVRESQLAEATVGEVGRLLGAYPQGTVAVISVDPARIRVRLREVGWQAERGNQRRWVLGGRMVTVVHPDAARGLEFDAVVVVEPSVFPQNFGRQGPLYTSLTRPNRELVVVHSAALPEALRPKKSR